MALPPAGAAENPAEHSPKNLTSNLAADRPGGLLRHGLNHPLPAARAPQHVAEHPSGGAVIKLEAADVVRHPLVAEMLDVL